MFGRVSGEFMERHANRHSEFRREFHWRPGEGDPVLGAIIVRFQFGPKKVPEGDRLPLIASVSKE